MVVNFAWTHTGTNRRTFFTLWNVQERGDDDADHTARFIRDMCEELEWFESDVLSSMGNLVSDDVVPFLIQLSEVSHRRSDVELVQSRS